MAVGILTLIESAVVVIIGVIMHVVILDYYPQIFGVHIALYVLAGLLIIYAIVDMARYQKRRKRRILRGQIAKDLKIQSKLSIMPTKTSVKSSIYGGQLNLGGKSSQKDKTAVKSSIFGGQSKNKR